MSTYAKAFEIPPGFPVILREFAKEAIRQQPNDIYKFGYNYFGNLATDKVEVLLRSADGIPHADYTELGDDMDVIRLGVNAVETQGSGEVTGADPEFHDTLTDRVSMLFQEADADGNGTLSRTEFQQVFELIGSEIGLTSLDILKIMAEADNNDDGVIEYREFLPVAVEIIQAITAKEQYANTKVIRQKRNSAKLEMEDYLMKGLPRHELEASIQQIFRAADGDNSGGLDRAEFFRCLKESGMGFTRRELNLILTLIDKNGDGMVDYQEFMPVCFSMIVQILSEKVQEVPERESILSAKVHAMLLKANGGRETLTTAAASEYVKEAGLGLRFVQVLAIMSEVEEDKDGVVAAQEVANAVAGVMCALEQLHIRQHAPEEDETVTVFKAAREMEGSSKVAGLNADEFTARLLGALKAKDEDGSGTLATRDKFREAVNEALPELVPQQVHALGSLLVLEKGGRWGYERVATWGSRTLQELVGQNVLLNSMNKAIRE